MELINVGYYIIETVPRPDYISLPCSKVISASPCICSLHPDLSGCFWKKNPDEEAEYRQQLGLTPMEFSNMSEMVSQYFQKNRIDTDSHFIYLSDAVNLYHSYLKGGANLHIVSISTTEKYLTVLEGTPYWGQNAPVSPEPIKGKLAGGEILGFDTGSFHSYLCNFLEKYICERHKLICDPDHGLIQNPFSEIEEFAACISGKGEPVDWIPFLLRDCTP